MKKRAPGFEFEKKLLARGCRRVAGVDEVGRGALAGPVVAGAVILAPDGPRGWLKGIRDSKQLTADEREHFYGPITGKALAWGVGIVPADFIDACGIVPATRRAMGLAIRALATSPDALLIDFMTLSEFDLPQEGIVKGDERSYSIACASIVAKVTRDRLMCELEGAYPGYGFAGHKGYASAEHLACLRRLGPCPVHRRSFRPVCEPSFDLGFTVKAPKAGRR
jgi:ribonuclease HII